MEKWKGGVEGNGLQDGDYGMKRRQKVKRKFPSRRLSKWQSDGEVKGPEGIALTEEKETPQTEGIALIEERNLLRNLGYFSMQVGAKELCKKQNVHSIL